MNYELCHSGLWVHIKSSNWVIRCLWGHICVFIVLEIDMQQLLCCRKNSLSGFFWREGTRLTALGRVDSPLMLSFSCQWSAALPVCGTMLPSAGAKRNCVSRLKTSSSFDPECIHSVWWKTASVKINWRLTLLCCHFWWIQRFVSPVAFVPLDSVRCLILKHMQAYPLFRVR